MPPAPLITCVGEILIDFVPAGAGDAGAAMYAAHPGGAPMNVAVAVQRLGGRAAFAGKVSRDHFGARLVEHLTQEAIDTRFLTRDDARSTLAFVEQTPTGPFFSFYGVDTADTRLIPGDLPAAFYHDTSVLHFGGISLLRGSTPDTVLDAAERLKAGGRTLLSLDPNIRPDLIADAEANAYRRRLDRAFALADVVKISAEDLTWYCAAASPAAFADRLIEGGAALVAITHGAAGSDLYVSGYNVHVASMRVSFVDAVGAGDAYAAGLLVALADRGALTAAHMRELSSDVLREIGCFATAAAAVVCGRAGAEMPWRREVEGSLG